jgi:hypothetical protein
MIATSHNTRGACEGCGAVRSFVMAAGFNPDATFRHLCASCERQERPRLQKRLFAGPVFVPVLEVVEERELPVFDVRQMALF